MCNPPTVADLYHAVLTNEKHTVGEKIKLLNEVRKINTAEGDRWVYRPVVYILGSIPVILAGAYATGAITVINDGLLSLGSAAVGALASFLTTGVTSKSAPVASNATDRTSAPDTVQSAAQIPAPLQPDPVP